MSQSVGTKIVVNGFQTSVEVFRFFRGTSWLSDSCVNEAIRSINKLSPRKFEVIDSITMEAPTDQVSEGIKLMLETSVTTGLLVVTKNHNGNHWIVMIFDFLNKRRVLFDSLQSRAAYGYMDKVCKEYFAPLLVGVYPTLIEEHFRGFLQKDMWSCGVYACEFVYHYVHGSLQSFLPHRTAAKEAARTEFLRLLYLHRIISDASIVPRDPDKEKTLVKEENVDNKKSKRHRKRKRPQMGDRNEPIDVNDTPSPSSSIKEEIKKEDVASDEDPPLRPAKAGRIKMDSPESPGSPRVSPESLKSPRVLPPPSPVEVTPITVTPFPVDTTGVKAGLSTIRNELIQFSCKNSKSGITLPLAAAYFVHHLDGSNKEHFVKIFKNTHHRVGDKFFLNQKIAEKRKAQSQQEQGSLKKHKSEVPSSPKISGGSTTRASGDKETEDSSGDKEIKDSTHDGRGIGESTRGDSTPDQGQSSSQASSSRSKDSTPDQGQSSSKASSSRSKDSGPSSSSSQSENSSGDSSGDSTDTDVEAAKRKAEQANYELLKETLKKFLQDQVKGVSARAVHFAMKPLSGSAKEIDAILAEIGERFKGKWFFKPPEGKASESRSEAENATNGESQTERESKLVSDESNSLRAKKDRIKSAITRILYENNEQHEGIKECRLACERDLGYHIKRDFFREVWEEWLAEEEAKQLAENGTSDSKPSPKSPLSDKQDDKSPTDNQKSVPGSSQDASRSSSTQDMWSLRKRKRVKQPTVQDYEAKLLPTPDHGVVENIKTIEVRNGVEYYQVIWEPVNKVRPSPSWLTRSQFEDFSYFEDQVDAIRKWLKSGLKKTRYYKIDPAAEQYLNLRKCIAADGDKGWCAFKAVGLAFELLTRRNPVNAYVIEAFQAEGVKRRNLQKMKQVTPDLLRDLEKLDLKKEDIIDDEAKSGTRWPEINRFIQHVCKMDGKIRVNEQELARNRYCRGGTGLDALRRCNLEDGVYLVAGFYHNMSAGHCVVLELVQGTVFVHDDDILGGVEILDWLHQLAYVRRVMLAPREKNSKKKKWKNKWKKKVQQPVPQQKE